MLKSYPEVRRGALFMLILYLCVWIPYTIFACLSVDLAVVLVPSIVGLASIPLYFAVKASASYRYSLSALVAHVVLSLIAYLLLRVFADAIASMYGSWASIGHALVWIALIVIGFVMLVLDGGIALVRRLLEGHVF